VGFETNVPASAEAKTVHALDRSATVTGLVEVTYLFNDYNVYIVKPEINVIKGKRNLNLNILNNMFQNRRTNFQNVNTGPILMVNLLSVKAVEIVIESF
jgi:hypothetical protein